MAKRRNGAVDFWRFIFAMILVVFHSYLLDPENAKAPVFLFGRGAMAVEFFLLTSGFLLAASMHKIPEEKVFRWRDTWTFVRHKISGFYPAYVITWVVGFTFVNYVRFEDAQKVVSNFFSSVFELLLVRNAGFNGYRVLNQAWYLSAMVLAIFILFPLYRLNKRRFEYYIAPAVAVVLLGYLAFKTKSLNDPNLFMTLSFKSTYRAIAEICLGVVCYVLCQKLKEKELSRSKMHLLTVLELGGYLSAIFYMQFYYRYPKYFDFIALMLIAMSVTISFSEKSSINPLFRHPVFSWLGKFSLYPYLTFIIFTKTLPQVLPGMDIIKLELIYVALTLLSGLVVMLIEKPFMKGVRAIGRLMLKKKPDTQQPAVEGSQT